MANWQLFARSIIKHLQHIYKCFNFLHTITAYTAYGFRSCVIASAIFQRLSIIFCGQIVTIRMTKHDIPVTSKVAQLF